MNATILVVDDEAQVRHSIAQWLELSGFKVDQAENPDAALAQLRRQRPEVVLTDFKMPGRSGLDLMRDVHRLDRDIPVVMLTAHGDVPLAVSAMREGAYDFLQKPYVPDHLSMVVNRAVEQAMLRNQLRSLTEKMAAHEGLGARLVGASPCITRVREAVVELAQLSNNVIIHGETGTGKEVVARALHDFGPRARAPFVAVNCAAVPEELFESELFGHEAGSFTGARGARIGKFEFANGGTILLDEIESMPLALQAKLLRVLQERVVERIGSNRCVPIDVRIVAATKYDLEEQGRAGAFRSDLYYRLCGAEIPLPPLRERESDVLLLFEHFSAQAAQIAQRAHRPLTPTDVDALLAHQWPGNIRELKAVAERHALGLRAFGRTLAETLGASSAPGDGVTPLADRVAAYERKLIDAALKEHGGCISQVIEALGIPRRTLNEKMSKYGLIRPVRNSAATEH